MSIQENAHHSGEYHAKQNKSESERQASSFLSLVDPRLHIHIGIDRMERQQGKETEMSVVKIYNVTE